jgi:sulfur relay protein TusB/DsrH
MILHVVNKSSALADCLALAPPEGAILLFEDAVAAALDTPENRERLASLGGNPKLYVLQPDLAARGLTRGAGAGLLPAFEPLGYAEFVALCTACTRVQSWF